MSAVINLQLQVTARQQRKAAASRDKVGISAADRKLINRRQQAVFGLRLPLSYTKTNDVSVVQSVSTSGKYRVNTHNEVVRDEWLREFVCANEAPLS